MLAPDIHAAIFGTRVVLLDVRADRYRLLSGDAARVIIAERAGRTVSDSITITALTGAGILIDAGCGPGPARTPLPPIPTGRLPDGMSPSNFAIFPTAGALLAARVRLRRLGLARTLAGAGKGYRSKPGADHESLALTVAANFARARALIPLSQACLPDSLALFAFLRRAGARATLVIGVRLDPFLAHCWVQTRRFVLNDDPDAILAYTPILAR